MPVLEGAPPTEDSAHRGAQRLFANGQSDRLGLPCAKPSAAATRMKKAPMKSHKFPITLSDNNDSDDDGVETTTQRGANKAPDCIYNCCRSRVA
jgi:hypothetical protein